MFFMLVHGDIFSPQSALNHSMLLKIFPVSLRCCLLFMDTTDLLQLGAWRRKTGKEGIAGL
jgi:hypothetical protein